MTCKEVLKRLKRRIKENGIKLVEEKWSYDYIGGALSFDDKKLGHITYNTIKLRTPFSIQKNTVKVIINKVISLLHELGHFEALNQMSLFKKQRLFAIVKQRNLMMTRWYPKEIIQAEKDAWDEAWKIFIDLGLNKKKNFKKKFQEEKIIGLRGYSVPLKECCV